MMKTWTMEQTDKERKETKNYLEVKMQAFSYNEKLARTIVAAFMVDMDPTVEEIADVKTAVSEAVTNAIIHGYGLTEDQETAPVFGLSCEREENMLTIVIEDEGCGIENVALAMEPLYTTRPDLERSGMGFAFMEAFMSEVSVVSAPGKGTKVTMKKKIMGALED